MPSTYRPGVFRYDEKLIQLERDRNLWDLLDEQEKANKLTQQQLDLQREQMRREEQAKVDADNKEKHNQMLESLAEKIRVNNEKIARIADVLDLDPVEYSNFQSLLKNIKVDVIKEALEQANEYVNELEQKKIPKVNVSSFTNAIEKAEKEIERVTKSSIIKQLIFHNKVKVLNSRINYWKSEIDKINKKHSKTIEDNNIAIKNAKECIEVLKVELNKALKYDIRPEFEEFRKTHYNLEVESLLKIDTYLKLPTIKPEDMISEGSIEDYTTYIRKKLLGAA